MKLRLNASLIRSFVFPPVSAAEHERQARVIRPVYWVGIALTFSVLIIQVLGSRDDLSVVLPTLLTFGVMLLILPAIRAGHERLATLVALLCFGSINAVAMLHQGGVISTPSRTYEVLIVAAGMIIGPRTVFLFLLQGCLAVLIALYAGLEGWISAALSPQLQMADAAANLGLMASTATIVYFAAEALKQRAEFTEGLLNDKLRHEEGLQRAERMQSLGQLAGGIAHDFNNLLMPIINNAKGLIAGEAERIEAAEAILRSATKAKDLTARMLTLSRETRLERRPQDLTQVLEDFMPLLRRSLSPDLSVKLLPSAEAIPVLVDARQLERALLNLALNANDATDGKGSLSISTHLGKDSGVLTFEDNGPGMDEAVSKRAFEPFFTTKEPGKGTGLGLSSVHSVMVQHGGEVRLETSPGAGCRFELHFPLAQPTIADAAPSGPWPGTLLLVEDDEDLRPVLKRMLELHAWKVHAVPSAEAALALAPTLADLSLLITDVRLPGQRGPALFAALKRERPSLRCLYISGYADMELDGPLLTKPFDDEELRAKLKEMAPVD